MGGGPVELIIQPEWVQAAKHAGACRVPEAGTPVTKLNFLQLCWAEGGGVH